MVDIIRRRNVQYKGTDYTGLGKANASIAQGIGQAISAPLEVGSKMFEQEQKLEQKRKAEAQKTLDASDKITASDKAGQLQNELLRYNLENRTKNPNIIGSREYEDKLRNQYSKLASKYSEGLGEAGSAEFTKKTQDMVNNMIQGNINWSYSEKVKKGEQAAQNIAQLSNNNAQLYGASGDISGFLDDYRANRETLSDYMDKVSPNNKAQALKEFDNKQMTGLFTGMAETQPELAQQILDNPELFKQTALQEVVADNKNALVEEKRKQLDNELFVANADVAKGDKKAKSRKKDIEKQINKLGGEEDEAEVIENMRKSIKESVGKQIEKNVNILKAEQEKENNQKKVETALSFMDNPIVYKAQGIEFDGDLKEKADEIYSLSDKVGNGKVDNKTLNEIVGKVASVTISEQGTDNNLLKAFEGYAQLQKAGADSDQLSVYQQAVAKALTDNDFKQQIAKLANKPRFDTMLTTAGSGQRGLVGAFMSKKSEDTQYVEDMGRDAYFNAMSMMINGEPEKAMAYYDSKVAEAYDYIKKDIIDVDYIKRALANNGSAMVELNGNMTKIVGRLPNGEYIIESTGEKVDGRF